MHLINFVKLFKINSIIADVYVILDVTMSLRQSIVVTQNMKIIQNYLASMTTANAKLKYLRIQQLIQLNRNKYKALSTLRY